MKHSLAIAIVIAFVALATIYSFVTPLGEGPDEPGHAAFVFFVGREARLPDQRLREVPGEGHQPPLAYVLAAPTLWWLPQDKRSFELPGNPRFVWAGGDQVNAAGHGSREFWPWQGAVLGWHMARLISVMCGAATVWFTYFAALHLPNSVQQATINKRRSKIGLLAAALVAFNPQFLFTSGLISNDALLAALSAALLWLALRHVAVAPRGGRVWTPLVLGIVLGLALLTKLSAVVLVPVALLGGVNWQADRKWRDLLHAVVYPCLIVLLTAATVCGWWYWRNWRLYGDALGLAAFQSEFATQPFDFASTSAWVGALTQLHNSFWVRFGWLNVAPPGWVLWVFGTLEIVAACGWALMLSRSATTDHRRVLRHVPQLIMCVLLAGAVAWLLAFARTVGLVAWQGRLLFPALPVIAILLATGVTRAIERGAWKTERGVRIGLYACLFLLALWLPSGVIQPAYSPQTRPEAAALAQLGTPVYGRFTPGGRHGAELRGYRLTGETNPGTSVDLTLMWHALGRQTRDWTVFVHLVDANEQIVAEDNREPRHGAYPMSLWVKGDWVEDTHSLPLPPDLPPGTYSLRIGLFDAAGTQERTGVYNQHNKLIGDYLAIGTIQVKSEE